MRIKLKLYALLTDYLPPGSQNHTTELEVAPDATPHQVIDRFKLPRQMCYLVLLNGVYLNPEERDRPVFKDGDALAIFPQVAGG